jgi:hypothetical protein
MFFYLEDYASKAILYAHTDLMLITNLQSGILDIHKRILIGGPTADKIQAHGRLHTNDIGIKFGQNTVVEFLLDNFPDAKRKQELIKLRAPLFEKLLVQSRLACANNSYGFNVGDDIYIRYALNQSNCINEYAEIMNLSPEFAKQELTMIVNSIADDRFRIFAICNMWKERINKCYTQADIDRLAEPMLSTFWMAGIPDV